MSKIGLAVAFIISFSSLVSSQESAERDVRALSKLGIGAEKEGDGTWTIHFEDDLLIGDSVVKKAMGTKDTPGPLRRLKGVKTLLIYNSPITSEGITALAELGDVETLVLSGTQVDTAGMKAIAKMRKLKFLMPGFSVTDEGLAQLVNHPRIEELDLQTCSLTDQGIDHLVGMKKLKALDLSNQGLSVDGLKKLKQIGTLESLHLRSANISDTDLAALSGIKSLKVLFLDFNTELTGSGFEQVTGLDSLEVLSIYQVHFEGKNLKYLTRFPKLKTLQLYGIKQQCWVRDFTVLSSMKELRKVVVGSSREDAVAEAEFAKVMPKVELKFLGE